METSLAIDNRLLETAFRMGGLKTHRDTVNIALEEFIKKRKMEDLINMFHSIDYAPNYNYKEMRYRYE